MSFINRNVIAAFAPMRLLPSINQKRFYSIPPEILRLLDLRLSFEHQGRKADSCQPEQVPGDVWPMCPSLIYRWAAQYCRDASMRLPIEHWLRRYVVPFSGPVGVSDHKEIFTGA